MTAYDIKGITEEYYSCFCGTRLSELGRGTHFICSAGRDEYLKAFGCKYTIWLLVKDDLLVSAYSPRYKELLRSLRLIALRRLSLSWAGSSR